MTSAEQLASGNLTPVLVLDVFLKLGIVLILIYLSLRLLRHYAQQASGLPARQPGDLSVRLSQWLSPWKSESAQLAVRTVQVHPLNRQVTLYLLEVESRRLLVSVCGSQVQHLGEWPAESHDQPSSGSIPSVPQPYLNLHSESANEARGWTDVPSPPQARPPVPPRVRPHLPPDPLNSESEKTS